MRIYIDKRDLWVGYFRGDDYHYVCPLPTLVIRWPNKRLRSFKNYGARR